MKVKDHFSIHKKKILLGGIVILLLAVALLWFKWPYSEYEGLGMRPDWDVADNIAQAPNHQIYANALYDFEYYTFLHGEGPFTIFLPTDKSYQKLSAELKYFLNDGRNNQGYIRQIVLYHIVKGNYLASDLKDGMKLKTVQGEELIVTKVNGQWFINEGLIETRDVKTKNGVIHIIGSFLLPPSIAALE